HVLHVTLLGIRVAPTPRRSVLVERSLPESTPAPRNVLFFRSRERTGRRALPTCGNHRPASKQVRLLHRHSPHGLVNTEQVSHCCPSAASGSRLDAHNRVEREAGESTAGAVYLQFGYAPKRLCSHRRGLPVRLGPDRGDVDQGDRGLRCCGRVGAGSVCGGGGPAAGRLPRPPGSCKRRGTKPSTASAAAPNSRKSSRRLRLPRPSRPLPSRVTTRRKSPTSVCG